MDRVFRPQPLKRCKPGSLIIYSGGDGGVPQLALTIRPGDEADDICDLIIIDDEGMPRLVMPGSGRAILIAEDVVFQPSIDPKTVSFGMPDDGIWLAYSDDGDVSLSIRGKPRLIGLTNTLRHHPKAWSRQWAIGLPEGPAKRFETLAEVNWLAPNEE